MKENILNKVFELQSITSTQKLVLMAVVFGFDDDLKCLVSFNYLVRITSLSRRGVIRAVHCLVKERYLKKWSTSGDCNIYELGSKLADLKASVNLQPSLNS